MFRHLLVYLYKSKKIKERNDDNLQAKPVDSDHEGCQGGGQIVEGKSSHITSTGVITTRSCCLVDTLQLGELAEVADLITWSPICNKR